MNAREAEEMRVAEVLAGIVRVHGVQALRDPNTVRSLLNDVLGADAPALRREIRVIIDAATEGVPGTLADPASGSWAHSSLEQRLTGLGLEPAAARFAVGSWARALGGATPPPDPSTAGLSATVLTGSSGVGQGEVGWQQNTAWNQQGAAWSQHGAAGQQGAHGWSQSLPPHEKPKRRGLLIGAIAGVLVLAAVGTGVAVAVLGGSGPAYGTGADGVAELRTLLPAVMDLPEGEQEGSSFDASFQYICGVENQPVVNAASRRYGPDPDTPRAAIQADAFASKDAAAAYVAEARNKLSGCDFDPEFDDYPNAIARIAFDQNSAVGLSYTIGFDCGCSTDPAEAENNLLYEEHVRIVPVANVVTIFSVISAPEVTDGERTALDRTVRRYLEGADATIDT